MVIYTTDTNNSDGDSAPLTVFDLASVGPLPELSGELNLPPPPAFDVNRLTERPPVDTSSKAPISSAHSESR